MSLAKHLFIEVWESEVPEKHRDAFRSDMEHVYWLHQGDSIFYHGEDGWVLENSTLAVSSRWLEAQRKKHGLSSTTPFYFRIMGD